MKTQEKVKKSAKGITLIALIITVIIMLILVGVAINMTIGDKGIFKRTADTVVIHENAEVYEQLGLKIVDDELGSMLENTELDKLNKLKNDGYVNEDNTVNGNIVTKANLKTGKGNMENGDVYVIEAEGSEASDYYLIYYTEDKERKNLGKLFGIAQIEPTPEDYFDFDPETGGISLKNIGNYYRHSQDFYCELGLKTIIIPSTYKGQTVTKIGMNCAIPNSTEYCSVAELGINAGDAEKIVIPNTVTKIGKWAFKNCNNLKEITIPDSVIEVGSEIFDECFNLEKVYVPFKEREQPSGWSSNWSSGGTTDKRQIIYKD